MHVASITKYYKKFLPRDVISWQVEEDFCTICGELAFQYYYNFFKLKVFNE